MACRASTFEISLLIQIALVTTNYLGWPWLGAISMVTVLWTWLFAPWASSFLTCATLPREWCSLYSAAAEGFLPVGVRTCNWMIQAAQAAMATSSVKLWQRGTSMGITLRIWRSAFQAGMCPARTFKAAAS